MRRISSQTIGLGGGVDGITPKSRMKPSSLLRGINIECKNNGGYRRVLGYVKAGPTLVVVAGAIEGMVWDDTITGDGLRTLGPDSPVVGVSVNLYDNNSVLLDTTVTGVGGVYSFTGLAAGVYVVHFNASVPYLVSWNTNVGGDDTIDNDAYNGTGKTDPITLATGEVVANIDCALLNFG